MARCKNDSVLAKIGVNKITKDMEVDFTVLSTLPDCKRINAKAYLSNKNGSTAVTATFSTMTRPKNQFECMGGNCVTSGTLFNGGATTVYHAPFDGTEFANGVITFYTKGATSVTVKVSSDADFTNADSYTVTPGTAGADGFSAVIVDLSKTPTTEGTGWSPSATGVYISIAPTGATASEIGISSIAIYDEKEDFETNAVVKISCLTDISGDIDIDTAEETCWTGGYDTDGLSFERTITGKALTPNYWLLNPLLGKGTATKGFEITTIERTVVADDGHGKITLADMAQDECGFIGIALADNCDVTEGMLTRLNVPTLIDMGEMHFIVIPGEEGLTDIYFNSALVGQTVVISYPKEVEIEELVADVDNVGTRRVMMSYKEEQTDGTKWVYVYGNVLVTTFPQSLTEDETEFSFTINIKKDESGHYYRKYRIL